VTFSPNDITQVAWTLWLISWLVAAKWSSPTVRRPSSRLEGAYRLFTACGAILLFQLHPRWPRMEVALWHVESDAAWMLVVLTICGFAFTWWARIVLGRLWSSGVTRKTEHTIITTGPYRLVRHPIYSGILFAVLATAGMRGTAAGALGALLIALGLVMKARVEERFLRDELGEDQYNSYARRVPMLVPFKL